jgi:phosphoribosylamine--glycine ligase
MNLLIIGSGGREHALAWKIAQSPKVARLYIAPGNAGTAGCGENLALDVDDHSAVVRLCREKSIDLVIVGPEGPLAAGLADALAAGGVRCFGPGRAAAQIEASKVFAKHFMSRHRIPTARFAAFTAYDAAAEHLRAVDYPVVIKASGLAAGKGVLLPESPAGALAALRQVMLERQFGAAGDAVVVEERMQGPEVTLLAFCDGSTVRAMPPSQDHKRALDGDRGPNTGGMGAYAPVPVCPPALAEELVRIALQPCVDGLRAEGAPFVGVLYGGFMLTAEGPRVVEFNCRFGDPETQVLLPLLVSDLLEVTLACVEGRLHDQEILWEGGAAAGVVLASGGYPGDYASGFPIDGLDTEQPGSFVFHAGTRVRDGRAVTAGGRVLCVTGTGDDLRGALGRAYSRIDSLAFEGMHFRRDIGARALETER